MGRRGGKSGKRRNIYAILVAVVAMIAIAVIAYVIHTERRSGTERPVSAEKGRPPSRPPETPPQPAPEQKKVVQEPEGTEEKPPKEKEKRPDVKKVAIIIDDIGYDLAPLRELVQIEAPVTFAVFPFGPHSVEAAKTLHRHGKQILLHLPMEPRLYPKIKVDKGALLMSMDHEQIRRQLDADLKAIPHIIGVNNHMGSRFMEDPEKLSVVMQEIRNKGLFFIDSRTTPLSKGQQAAASVGVPFAARKIFLDNDKSYRETRKSLMMIIQQKKNGDLNDVILIGHPRSSTIEALKSVLPLFKEQGIEVVSASGMVRQVQERNISRRSSSHAAD